MAKGKHPDAGGWGQGQTSSISFTRPKLQNLAVAELVELGSSQIMCRADKRGDQCSGRKQGARAQYCRSETLHPSRDWFAHRRNVICLGLLADHVERIVGPVRAAFAMAGDKAGVVTEMTPFQGPVGAAHRDSERVAVNNSNLRGPGTACRA